MGTWNSGRLIAGIVALTVGCAAGPAFADGMDKKGSLKDSPAEEPKRELQITANVAATTEYVFRGFSQSAEHWAAQGGVDLAYKWLYAGVWSSSIDFGKDGITPEKDVAHVEIDYYAGVKPVIGPVTFDIGVIYYTYPNAFDGGLAASRELDYVEVKLGASGSPWKDGTISLTGFYSPEYTNDTGAVWTVEGSISQSFAAIHGVTPSISALIGYQAGDDLRYAALVGNGDDSYLYWNAGVTLGFGDRFSLDFRYWDTDIQNNNAAAGFTDGFCTGKVFQCDDRFVATAKVTY
ncbi:MAG: TorF family putative porin [Hyphomicrobiaceae bacterium]|nr:TorF family putative porin [Hyphomicrobiaceae bacterium]